MDTSKVLIIGCGGIGSWFIQEIKDCFEQEQITSHYQFDIADNDIVELEQIRYQNFNITEIGKSKSKALVERTGFDYLDIRINKEKYLEEYDLFVLCVDNEKTREMVIKYCHKHNKEFLDLRATGRRIFAMPKLKSEKENLKFVDINDKKEYSCQEKRDIDMGRIQKGNKIVAQIGVQMFLNLIRGYGNRIISLVV